MSELRNAALYYTSLGWLIFPLSPGTKKPIKGTHGVKEATLNLDQIGKWWTKYPDANIGLACGKQSGVYVIDVDLDAEKGINGYESLKEFPPLPETIKQNTPRGGFHAFYETDNPPRNENNFRPGIDIRGDGYYVVLAPSKCPNGAYTWVHKYCPWSVQPAAFPVAFRPQLKTPWAAASPSNLGSSTGRATTLAAAHGIQAPCADTVASTTIRDERLSAEYRQGVLNILKRASLYLAECNPAVQGMGGHNSLLWAAVAMVHGFLLSDADATKLLIEEYNPRCVPEWDLSIPSEQRDFTRKVQEARKLNPQQTPGWLLEDEAYAPAAMISIDSAAMIRRFQEEQEAKRVIGPISHTTLNSGASELEYLQTPLGLVGDICDWINRTAIKRQPFLSLACTLTFCGTLFGRKISDHLDNRTNLYCMGIAPSSAGKAHGPNQIRKLCEHAGCLDLLGGDEAASDAAIECRLERNPSTLFLWDEIGLLLSYIQSGSNPHVARIVSLLMKLYSAAGVVYKGREYADAEKQRTIVQPCCSVYGTSTPTRFCEGITLDELQDGWLSRCLVFEAFDNPPKTRENRREPVPPDISDLVNLWNMREIGEQKGNIESFSAFQSRTGSVLAPTPQQIIAETTPAAEKIFIDFDIKSNETGRKNPDLLCLWAKAEENARRISLIVAAGCDFEKPTNTKETASYACALIRYLLTHFINSTVPNIVSSKTDLNKRKLLEIIKKSGTAGCSKGLITKVARWSNSKQRKELLADLIEAEEVVCKQKENENGAFHWTVANYNEYLKGETG